MNFKPYVDLEEFERVLKEKIGGFLAEKGIDGLGASLFIVEGEKLTQKHQIHEGSESQASI